MPKIKSFPKTVTVKIEPDNTDDYLLASPGTDLESHAEMGQKTKVGLCSLVEVVEVEGVAKSRSISKAK